MAYSSNFSLCLIIIIHRFYTIILNLFMWLLLVFDHIYIGSCKYASGTNPTTGVSNRASLGCGNSRRNAYGTPSSPCQALHLRNCWAAMVFVIKALVFAMRNSSKAKWSQFYESEQLLKKITEQQKLKGEAINISLPLMFWTNFEEKFSELHEYRYMAVFFTPLLLSHQYLVTKVDFVIKIWTKQRAVRDKVDAGSETCTQS
jgi:hypothetical protein